MQARRTVHRPVALDRIARAAGVQSEMELAFAGLHQLCAPMLDGLDRLPSPQREALRVAFGLQDGPAPDRYQGVFSGPARTRTWDLRIMSRAGGGPARFS